MTPAAEALLLSLTKRPTKTTPETGETARALCAAGLAELRQSKTGTTLGLTAAGLEQKEATKKSQAAAKKEAAAPAKKPAGRAGAVTTADLEALAARLTQQLDALEERLAARIEALLTASASAPAPASASASASAPASAPASASAPAPAPASAPAPAPAPASAPVSAPVSAPASADVADRVVRATDSLTGKHGRLVPIADLRRALGDVPRPTLDRVLFDLERRRQLYLKIANDPLAVPHPEDGIRIDGRGLVYFAALP